MTDWVDVLAWALVVFGVVGGLFCAWALARAATSVSRVEERRFGIDGGTVIPLPRVTRPPEDAA